jgi:hypothetical protein
MARTNLSRLSDRLIWFAALWLGSVASLALVGTAIRIVLRPS